MLDGRGSDRGALFSRGAGDVLWVRWQDTAVAGSEIPVEVGARRGEIIDPLVIWACGHDAPQNGNGYNLHIEAMDHPDNEVLSTHDLCIGNGSEEIERFDVAAPEEPGDHTLRLLFMLPNDSVSYEMMFPEQTHPSANGLVSEVHVPITVHEDLALCGDSSDCPEGTTCVGGECQPIGGDEPPDDPDEPEDGGSGAGVAVVGLGAAYLYLRNRGGL